MTVGGVRGPIGRPQDREWSGLFERLLAFGTESYPPKVRRRLRILNAATGLMALFSMVFALSYALRDPDHYLWVIVINLALVASAVAAPFLHRFHELAAPFVLGTAWFVALFLLVALLGRTAGIQLNFFIVAGAAFVVLGLERLPLVIFWIVLAFALHVTTWLAFERADEVLYANRSFLNQLYVSAAFASFCARALISRKFTYDVWGDAVNLAARLENSSEPGMIHVSPEVRAALADAYELQPRGPINIKGVGTVETSFLLAPRGRDATTAAA